MTIAKTAEELRQHPVIKEVAAIFTGRQTGRLIFFGAGFSITAGVKGWKALLSDLNTKAKINNKVLDPMAIVMMEKKEILSFIEI